jgi:serine/threonine protein kinase
MSPLEPGTSLGEGFTLERRLGQGGGGEVWLCRHRDETVVAKLVPSDAPAATLLLLERECRLLRRLDHPNIVRVRGFHRTGAAAFVAMDYVDGPSLADLRGAPPSRILEAVLPIAEALDHAHSLGIVHRDVKLGNVRCDSQGRPHLLDFGIAGVLSAGQGEPRLRGGGSRHGASPEQLAGEEPQPADDIYAFGALLYELLAGHPPPRPEPGGPPSGYPLPQRLQVLVGRLLARTARERPPSMSAVVDELRSIRAELPPTSGEPMPFPLDKKAIRLTPPPRAAASQVEPRPTGGGASTLGAPGAPRSLPRRVSLGSTVLLGALCLAAASVFVYLPRPAARPESPGHSVPQPAEAGTGVEAKAGPAAVEAPDPDAVPRERPPAASAVEKPVPVPSTSPRTPPGGDDFAAAISETLQSLDQGDLVTARAALARAAASRPDAAEVADARAQLDQLERLQAIDLHSRRAAELEAREEWAEAAREHAAVLAVDGTIVAAQAGQERCVEMAGLYTDLSAHIAHAERLSTPAVYQEARDLLERAMAVRPAGPRLADRIVRLHGLLLAAATPVEVELLSDGLTDVVVYRVGPLGRFERRRLELLPGTYTVVGRRQGYRDVRRQLQVAPGAAPSPLLVRCEETV